MSASKANSRPTEKASRAERPEKRIPIAGNRDVTTVYGQRDDLSYRWILDKEETGQRIWKFQRAGWTFVKPEEVTVGEALVFDASQEGSLIRLPAGDGQYQYLMCISKELYDEDQAAKQRELDATEDQIMRAQTNEGQYGKVEISK